MKLPTMELFSCPFSTVDWISGYQVPDFDWISTKNALDRNQG